jgi:hypothetical protein
LAQQEGFKDTIVGVEEVIADNTAKANWDDAGALAQELQQGIGDKCNDDKDEIYYTEALGKATREAVESFEEDMQLQNNNNNATNGLLLWSQIRTQKILISMPLRTCLLWAT